jgi:hypothetical protein
LPCSQPSVEAVEITDVSVLVCRDSQVQSPC